MQYSTVTGVRAGMLWAVVCFASQAQAQNLVPNPNFDSVLTPWTQFLSSAPDPGGAGAAPTRVGTPDVDASPSSGSALIDITTSINEPLTNAASGISQCFDFAAPTSVTFVNYGMSFLVPAATTADSALNATVEIRLFADGGCANFISGGSQGRVVVPGLASDTTWYTVGDTGFSPPSAPVMAASAEIRAYLRQTGSAPSVADYKVNVDKFRLVLNSTTPVRLQQFDVE